MIFFTGNRSAKSLFGGASTICNISPKSSATNTRCLPVTIGGMEYHCRPWESREVTYTTSSASPCHPSQQTRVFAWGNPRVNAFAQAHPMFLRPVNMVRYSRASFVATRFTIPLATPSPGRSESIVVSWKSRFLVFPGHPQPFQKKRAETLRKTGALNLTLDQVS